jgi:hypothetical protein
MNMAFEWNIEQINNAPTAPMDEAIRVRLTEGLTDLLQSVRTQDQINADLRLKALELVKMLVPLIPGL